MIIKYVINKIYIALFIKIDDLNTSKLVMIKLHSLSYFFLRPSPNHILAKYVAIYHRSKVTHYCFILFIAKLNNPHTISYKIIHYIQLKQNCQFIFSLKKYKIHVIQSYFDPSLNPCQIIAKQNPRQITSILNHRARC